MKSFLAGLGIALAAAMVWRKQAESRQQPRHLSPDTRPDRKDDGKEEQPPRRIEVVRQRSRSESRSHSAPTAAASPETPARTGSSRSGGAEEVLNSATRQQLLSVYGIGPVLADRIIQNRPYKAAYDVVEKGIIPESIYVQLRKQLLQQHGA